MSLIEVRQSSIHNKGVFALKHIKKGTKIIEYTGEKISLDEWERRADEQEEMHKKDPTVGAVYIFELDEETLIDGSKDDNIAKYINHSCKTNCEVEIANKQIWIVAERDINAGEELFFNYGYEFDDDFESHPCKCGNENCVGYILAEEDWPKLKSKQDHRES